MSRNFNCKHVCQCPPLTVIMPLVRFRERRTPDLTPWINRDVGTKSRRLIRMIPDSYCITLQSLSFLIFALFFLEILDNWIRMMRWRMHCSAYAYIDNLEWGSIFDWISYSLERLNQRLERGKRIAELGWGETWLFLVWWCRRREYFREGGDLCDG